MVREAPGRHAGGREAGYSQLARVPCEYGSCQCTRLTYRCVFRGGFVPNNGSIGQLEKTARNPATHAGEADFLKRS